MSAGTAARDRGLTPRENADLLMTQPDRHNDEGSKNQVDRAAAAAPDRASQLTTSVVERESAWVRDFTDLSYEWRRLFSELFGTFLLVLAAAGGAVIQDRSIGQIGRVAEVTAPALTAPAPPKEPCTARQRATSDARNLDPAATLQQQGNAGSVLVLAKAVAIEIGVSRLVLKRRRCRCRGQTHSGSPLYHPSRRQTR